MKKDTKLKEVGDSKDAAGSVLQEGGFADDKRNIYYKWSFTFDESKWNDAIKYINLMQEKLRPLSDEERRIRIQIAGLVHCNSGFPVTADQILESIGNGKLPDEFFHAGCWYSLGTQTTQPRQVEVMRAIEEILLGYLDGKQSDEFIEKYPFAHGFIERTYAWLGPVNKLSEVQHLMFKRLLLPFEAFTGRTDDREAAHKRCFEEGGEGFKLDDEISKAAGLPDIHVDYQVYQKNMQSLDNTKKKLYRIAYTLRWGLPELSDCHHATFRKIERWPWTNGLSPACGTTSATTPPAAGSLGY